MTDNHRPASPARTNPKPPPTSTARTARIDALVTQFDELVTLDSMDPTVACRLVVDSAMPEAEPRGDKLPLGAKVVLWIFALIVLLVTFPIILWTVGHVVVPAFQWGTSWI